MSTTNKYVPPPDRLPSFECSILATAVLSSAISISSLFPYVGFMVVDLGLVDDVNDAGEYAGFIGSAMMFGRFISSVYWGQKADIVGRKPVLVIGIIAVVVFGIMFGMSTTFVTAMLSRFLLGLMNPTWGMAKTLVSEIAAPPYQAQVMGLTSGCWSLGLVIGPALGGLLANPCKLYPESFGGNVMFSKYPYLLPNLINSIFGSIALILVIVYFPETLPARSSLEVNEVEEEDVTVGTEKQKLERGKDDITSQRMKNLDTGQKRGGSVEMNISDEGNVDDDNCGDGGSYRIGRGTTSVVDLSTYVESKESDMVSCSELDEVYDSNKKIENDSNNSNGSCTDGGDGKRGASVWELVWTPGVMSGIFAYFWLSFVSIVYDEIFPLWVMSDRDKGGLSMPQIHIGQIMSFTGMILLFYTFCLYPICAKALGSKMGFRVGQFLAAPCFLITTLLHYVPANSSMLIPLTIAAVSITKMSVALAFSSIALLLNETVSAEKRASMNGLSMSLGSLSKGLGPFSGSLTLAWSINNGLPFPLDSHFVYICIFIIAIASSCLPLRSVADDRRENEAPTKNYGDLHHYHHHHYHHHHHHHHPAQMHC